MRAVQITDWHLDARRQLAGVLREYNGMNVALSNTAACVRAVAAAALAAGPVDVWLVTGDVTDTATPTQQEVRVMVELVDELARFALVVIVAGNHDVPGAGAGAPSLEALKLRPRVIVVEVPTVLYLARRGAVLDVLDVDPYAPPVPGACAEAIAAVACLPYPRRSELVTAAPEGSREERYALASEALRGVLQASRVAIETTAPQAARLVAYHGTIDGATVGVQPRTIQGDITLSVGDFAGFHFVGAGHIHKMQRLAPTVFYAGSVDRVDFDEAADFKGGLEIVVGEGAPLAVKPIPSPARKYVTLSPAQLAGYVYQPDIVYRVRGDVTPTEAIELRRTVADIAATGVWIAAALNIEARVRVRDEQATAEEPTSALLARWLAANPQHIEDIVGSYGGTKEHTVAEVIELSAKITGE